MHMLKGTLRRIRSRKNPSVIGGPAVGTLLTFRAEVMPGRETHERTFEVERVLTSGRIELQNLQGEHTLTEFEPLPD
jgi:hypothetical protein